MLLQRFRSLLTWYVRARTQYDIHSPFVFDFIREVLEDDRNYYAFSEVERYRRSLRRNRTRVVVRDFGAGSMIDRRRDRTVGEIARGSASHPHTCRLLFRMVRHYKPRTLLELGTSLGISASYQAMASPHRLFTLEGCPNVASQAQTTFRQLGLDNVTLVQGAFQDTLPKVLAQLPSLDYLFVDGNHRYEPTLSYFRQCLPLAHAGSVFLFDDIHWSTEMEAAWKVIREHPSVHVSVDLYHLGMVFFRPIHPGKAHYELCPWSWKPWRIGWW
ncbi:MAG: hypothetical protein RLY31_2582 [Bacteroidota bacterium]|jgi:predicted O-methyltransferase YrrM